MSMSNSNITHATSRKNKGRHNRHQFPGVGFGAYFLLNGLCDLTLGGLRPLYTIRSDLELEIY